MRVRRRTLPATRRRSASAPRDAACEHCAPGYYDDWLVTPFGAVGIHLRQGRVTSVDLLDRRCRGPRPRAATPVRRALSAYLHDPRRLPRLPLTLVGTPFQKRVWRALQRIPAGKTTTYGELAARLGTSPRAIGLACRANPIPIFVPCHRVVAASSLGGFMGASRGRHVAIKRWLLDHERAR